MSQLTAIVDNLLSNVSSAYVPKGMIVEQALPSIKSKEQTGKLAKYGTNHLRIETSLKGGRGAYRRVEAIARSQSSYAIEGHGLEGLVTKEDYKNVQLPYKAEEDEVMGLSSILWLEKEKALADTMADTSIITQTVTLTATDQYNDYLNSDPIDDFNTARATVKSGCGLPPDTAIMSWEVWNKLRFHPQMLDALGYKQNRPGGLKEEEMAAAIGVERVLIGMATYESAAEGQTSSLAAVWGKHVFFAVLPMTAVPYQVSTGYLIGYDGEVPRKVYKQANFNPPGATSILVEDNYDMFISNALAAYSIKSAIA